MTKDGHYNGWGRLCSQTGVQIGHWKDSALHGNCRILKKDGTIRKEGWFDNGNYQGGLYPANKEFKYFDPNAYLLS